MPHLRGVLLSLNEGAFTKQARRSLRVLKSFAAGSKCKFSLPGGIDLELGFDAEKGSADSGDLEHDLGELLVSVAEAAASRKNL